MKKINPFKMSWQVTLSVILISFSSGAIADGLFDVLCDDEEDALLEIIQQLGSVNMKLNQIDSQLQSQQMQLNQIDSQLESQQMQLTELQQETIDCTPERYLNNLCGEGNTPFDLVVSICGNLGGEVAIGGNYALGSATTLQAGLGWAEVVDVNVGLEGSMPGLLPLPFPVPPLILPSEVSVGAGGSIGLGMDTCFEGIKIPIGKNVDRDRVIALLSKLEMDAEQVQSVLLDAIDNTYNSLAVATALTAKDTFASHTFESSDPLAVFTSPEVIELVSLLPAGDRISALITNPGDMIPEIDPLNLKLCDKFADSPTLGGKIGDLCSFVNGLPDHQLVIGAFQTIKDIKTSVIGIPAAVKNKICDVLPDSIC